MTTRHLATASLFIALAACSGSSSSTSSAAPEIHDLTLNPTTVPVGKLTQVNGSVGFSDPQGDVSQIAVEFALPSGQTQTVPHADAQGTAGVTAGTVSFVLVLQAPTAEPVTVTVSVFDKAGNESNRLSTTVTAQ